MGMLDSITKAAVTANAMNAGLGKCPFKNEFCSPALCELFDKQADTCTFKLITRNQVSIAEKLDALLQHEKKWGEV